VFQMMQMRRMMKMKMKTVLYQRKEKKIRSQ
jgi:hypothetical protein